MFDFDLHFRFLQKATEAYFETAQAAFAANIAWQSRLNQELSAQHLQPESEPDYWSAWASLWAPTGATSRGRPGGSTRRRAAPAEDSPWQPWFGAFAFDIAAPKPAIDPMQSWIDAASAWQQLAQHAATAACGTALSAWSEASKQPMWNASPWTIYQAPLMATMLSYGVPYTVAAPAARASTAAMEAADAAYTQWKQIFGTSQALSRHPAMPPWQAYPI